jgi:hypothetical protein
MVICAMVRLWNTNREMTDSIDKGRVLLPELVVVVTGTTAPDGVAIDVYTLAGTFASGRALFVARWSTGEMTAIKCDEAGSKWSSALNIIRALASRAEFAGIAQVSRWKAVRLKMPYLDGEADETMSLTIIHQQASAHLQFSAPQRPHRLRWLQPQTLEQGALRVLAGVLDRLLA